MTDSPFVLSHPRWPAIQNHITTGLVFLYQAVVIVAFAAIPVLALRWLRAQSAGASLEPDSAFRIIFPGPLLARWELFNQLPGYQLLFIPYLIGIVYLASSLWVFLLRRRDGIGQAFAIFAASTALCMAGLFDVFTTGTLMSLWALAFALAGGALVHLALIFPQEWHWVSRYPFIRLAGYLFAGLLAVFALQALDPLSPPAAYPRVLMFEIVFLGLGIILFLASAGARRLNPPSPMIREQARLVLWGAGLSFTPLAVGFLVTMVKPEVSSSGMLLLPLALFPASTGYVLLRYRFLHTDTVLSRLVVYALLSVIAAASYSLLVAGISLVIGRSLPANHPALIGLLVILLAFALQPSRQYLQQKVDAIFFRGQIIYRERIQNFSGELTQALDLPAILAKLREFVVESIYPYPLHVFVHDSLSDAYVAFPGEDGKPTSDLRFPSGSPIVQILSRRRSPLFFGGSETLPVPLQSERARLALLDVQLIVPLAGRDRLAGWLALGERLSGEPYTSQDLSYLDSLCDQAALAVERSQVVIDLGRQVRAMNVLARVAQAANITLAFDDLLELVYAQTAQAIPTRDFRIVLKDPSGQGLYYAFYLENDERLRDHETIPIAPNQGLEGVVIRSQHILACADYERECRARSVRLAAQGVYAWLGVPLSAGADTIGAVSVGSRDPSSLYTEEQCNLMQAIADQAAGAIVKALLLQETERRARQLATLNEIGRSLSSTLEIRPLLSQILHSATTILNCEAGSLFLVDEKSGELVFEVTAGPVAENLVGQRLAPGTGLVGKAVSSAQPIIANDARRSQSWFGEADQKTGFVTRDLLVVPMQAKDRVIGVIEVINKTSGSPFYPDDRDLLATFASQAAVAVENARLYTQTDEALAARVEELSVMQRIDRELNASLDSARAMSLTLEWAMNHSGAEAGLAGIVEGAEIHIIASQGFPDSALAPDESENKAGQGMGYRRLGVVVPAISSALESGQLQCWVQPRSEGILPKVVTLLESASSQLVLPIRREERVIGLLLLESRKAGFSSAETQAYLSRLSDHAAIAIANAQLYTAVQEANRAKSEFVSFVSHELKTPMTSIKGYADLLAAGSAGPVNEIQGNFLNTIRSNVLRMSTLVSDLSDVSRIESGRLRLDFRSVSLKEVIDEVVRGQKAQIEAKEQNLLVQVTERLPPAWGDYIRLVQVLTNLVSNAHKYSPRGGLIMIRAEPAGASGEVDSPKAVHVLVSDNGYGILPEDQKKIFQKFFRSEDQNIRDVPGTGLGLNITRYLVEMQGGQIWFESEPGKGSTFHFTVLAAAEEVRN